MIMAIIVAAAYMIIGAIYYTCTCEDRQAVANPFNWIVILLTWGIVMWRS